MAPAASTPTRPQHAGKDKKTNTHTPSTRKNLKGVVKKVTVLMRVTRALGLSTEVVKQEVVTNKVCVACDLNSAVVGSVFRGADRILKDYILGKKVGEGAFSEVFLLKFKQSGKMFADKLISKLNEAYDHPSLEKEVQIMKLVDHPNVMRLFAVYDEPTKAHLVLELVRGSNMLDRMDSMGILYSETVAAKVLDGCLSGLRCIHSMHITHRDLKPENLMFTTDDVTSDYFHHVKLCDLGLAQKVNSQYDLMSTICGTPGYMAPELLSAQGYTPKVDMWSMGAIMFWMFSSDVPFNQDDENIHKFLRLAQENTLHLPLPAFDNISRDAKGLIFAMLEGDPKKRISASQAMDHPWIKFQGESFNMSIRHNHWLNHSLRKLSPVFSDFGDDDVLAALTNVMKRQTFEPGSQITIDGGISGVYYIESGVVNLVIENTESTTMTWSENMFFATLSLCIADRPVLLDARLEVATGGLNFPATIYTLGEEAFVQLVTDLPKLGRRFASIAATCVERLVMYDTITKGPTSVRRPSFSVPVIENPGEVATPSNSFVRRPSWSASFNDMDDLKLDQDTHDHTQLPDSPFERAPSNGKGWDFLKNGFLPKMAVPGSVRMLLRTMSAETASRKTEEDNYTKQFPLWNEWRTRRCLANLPDYVSRAQKSEQTSECIYSRNESFMNSPQSQGTNSTSSNIPSVSADQKQGDGGVGGGSTSEAELIQWLEAEREKHIQQREVQRRARQALANPQEESGKEAAKKDANVEVQSSAVGAAVGVQDRRIRVALPPPPRGEEMAVEVTAAMVRASSPEDQAEWANNIQFVKKDWRRLWRVSGAVIIALNRIRAIHQRFMNSPTRKYLPNTFLDAEAQEGGEGGSSSSTITREPSISRQEQEQQHQQHIDNLKSTDMGKVLLRLENISIGKEGIPGVPPLLPSEVQDMDHFSSDSLEEMCGLDAGIFWVAPRNLENVKKPKAADLSEEEIDSAESGVTPGNGDASLAPNKKQAYNSDQSKKIAGFSRQGTQDLLVSNRSGVSVAGSIENSPLELESPGLASKKSSMCLLQ